MGEPYFRFQIRLDEGLNPQGTHDRLTDDLRAWVRARGFPYGIGALGGSVCCYGHIGPDPTLTDDYRQAMAAFMRQQPMVATVKLEALVPFDERRSMMEPIVDWVFQVDGLSDEQRAEAARYRAEMLRGIEKLKNDRA